VRVTARPDFNYIGQGAGAWDALAVFLHSLDVQSHRFAYAPFSQG